MTNSRPSDAFFLSYPLGPSTPEYGQGPGIKIDLHKRISCGDSCNTASLTLSNHLGTHVDAPLHFIDGAKSVDSYSASDLVFRKVQVIEIPIGQGRLFQSIDFEKYSPGSDVELLLIKTGFGAWRGDQKYVFDGPGFSETSATTLLKHWPMLRGLGMDFLSASRYSEREEGRAAHRVLLSHNDLILVEDMDLSKISSERCPVQVWVAPLRVERLDGAPCTVVAWV